MQEELNAITIWISQYSDFVNWRWDYHTAVICQSLISQTQNNQVWEVLTPVAHTWDPGGFDTGGEGGEVLIGFLGAPLLTFQPRTFRHSSSALSSSSSSSLRFLYAEEPKLRFDETHLFDLTLASPSQLKSRRPVGCNVAQQQLG